MTDQRPEPFTAPNMDVRDLDGFMLNTERLLASELWALSTGDEFKAAVGLWCRAWKQIPAGSLPNDERVLASFAGVPIAKWRKIRAIAMRGFVECSDGRLYHRVLCEDVKRAFTKKAERRERTRAATEARKKDRNDDRDENRDDERDVQRNDNRDVDVTRSQRQGQGQGQGREEGSEAKASGAVAPELPMALEERAPEPPAPSSEPVLDDKHWLFNEGLAWISKEVGKAPEKLRSQLGRWLRDAGNDATLVRRAIEEAQRERVADPVAWLIKVLPLRIREGRAKTMTDDERWDVRVKVYADTGVWPFEFGPKPDQPKCQAPVEILRKHHYEPPDFLLRRPQLAAVN